MLGVVVLGALGAAACAPSAGPRPAPAPPPPAQATPSQNCSPDSFASQLLDLVNQSRADAGVAPLTWDDRLGCLARDWSTHMASTGRLEHRDLNATINSPGYENYKTLGENIARGPRSMSATSLHSAWMASDAHRANILSAAYTTFGFGSASSNLLYATENFGG